MTQPSIDWDAAYRQEAPPPWSIGAALSLVLAARGYTVVGLDASATAVDAELPNAEHDNDGHFMVPGFLLTARKPD